MLARSRQLQGIFGLLKPFLHVQILICFVDVYQNHGVLRFSASDLVKNLLLSVFLERPLEEQEEILLTRWSEPIQKPLNRNVDNFINEFLEKNDFIDLKTQSGKKFDKNLG